MNRVLLLVAVATSFLFRVAGAQVEFIDTGITYTSPGPLPTGGISESGQVFANVNGLLYLRSAAGVVTTVTPPLGSAQIAANSINASGLIGGNALDAAGNPRGVLRRPDGTYFFPIPGGRSEIGGVNEAGDAVGSLGPFGSETPFRYVASSGGISSLTRPSGTVAARATMINSSGVIGGLGSFPIGPGELLDRLIRYAPDGSVSVLAGPPGEGSDGSHINSAGDIAGSRHLSPFVWNADGSQRTLSGDGFASGINDVGDVVGILFGPQGSLAVAWDAFGASVDLNEFLTPAQREHWRLVNAWDVNNTRTIVGFGQFDPDGAPGPLPSVIRVYLLTIPEPSLAGPVAISLSALIPRRRDRSAFSPR